MLMHQIPAESVILMKPEMARKLAIRMSQIMDRYDHYEYVGTLMDYDGYEDLMLDDLVGQIESRPELVFDGILNTMEQMLNELKR